MVVSKGPSYGGEEEARRLHAFLEPPGDVPAATQQECEHRVAYTAVVCSNCETVLALL